MLIFHLNYYYFHLINLLFVLDIIQEKGKGGDVKKLTDSIKRAKEITKLIKHLSNDVKRGEKVEII